MADEWSRIQGIELRVGANISVSIGEQVVHGVFLGHTGSQLMLQEMFERPVFDFTKVAAPEPTGYVHAIFIEHIVYINAAKRDIRVWEIP